MQRMQLIVPELCTERNYLYGAEHLGRNSVDTNVGIAAIAETVLESEPHDDDSAPWSHPGDLTDITPRPGRRPPPSLRSVDCDGEFVCCELMSATEDNILDLQKVSVHLRHNGQEVETFRSCCEFSQKFENCPNHSSPQDNLVAGVFCQALKHKTDELMARTILSESLDSVTESEWSKDEDDRGEDGGSSSDSDWMEYAEEICTEDLPRLGLVQLTDDFHSDPFEWRFADRTAHPIKLNLPTALIFWGKIQNLCQLGFGKRRILQTQTAATY
ncbi:hypothetical protein R1sor_018509 [Riccia sorocarpa]|uniref:Uncharacterized protein n=1 Tax=Riccia sorocarpa TaxID=122646 RepID=A0ABD3I9Z2_9MARC